MFNRSPKSKAQSVATQTVPTRRLVDERDVMRARAEQVLLAERAVSELAANVETLEKIIADDAAAQAAVQAMINDEGIQSSNASPTGRLRTTRSLSWSRTRAP